MESIEPSARKRIASCARQQSESLAAIHQGVPRAAEPDFERARQRIEAEQRFSPEAFAIRIVEAAADAPAVAGPERIWGASEDFVGVAFLERGMNAARCVGRVAFRDSSPNGTGFLIAPGLFLTNHHVIGSEAECQGYVVEFDYETDALGRRREPSRFELDPAAFFITDETDDLDYTLVAIGRRVDGPLPIDAFGFSALSAAGNKHTLGEVANIVQHPAGRLKEVVLRENRLVSRLSHVLHYVSDTEPGSSGSPVFNNQWQAIALHHWGGPWRQDRAPDGRPVPRHVNEGIRISAVVDELRDHEPALRPEQRRRLRDALSLGETTQGIPKSGRSGTSDDREPRVEVRADGTAVWRVPLEVSVGIPAVRAVADDAAALGVAAPGVADEPPEREGFRRRVDRAYSGRRGYRERFLSGQGIPMPSLSGADARLARNLRADAGDDPFEFAYEHFSVYVDKGRGLPLLTACNIDGANLKRIDRDTGRVVRAESLAPDPAPMGGMEAREKWFDDPRIDPDECGDDTLYLDQRVSDGPNRTGRIFHRGHMVRRLDPCWGSDAAALRAEADTFHFTNCTPQVGAFNSGRSLWLGIEDHVLKNARAEDRRVTVFTGPVLDPGDPPYRQDVFPGFRVPTRFWKVAVWRDAGELMALALIADQTRLLREMPEGLEALDDPQGLEDFHATVPWVEEMTGLDFTDAVRRADLFEEVDGERAESVGGGRGVRIRSLGDLPLTRSRRGAKKRSRGRRPQPGARA